MLTLVIQEMSKEFPTLMETLVHERDKLVSLLLLIFIFYLSLSSFFGLFFNLLVWGGVLFY